MARRGSVMHPLIEAENSGRTDDADYRTAASVSHEMSTMPDHAATCELPPPDPPAFPYGHVEFVRFIGPPNRR
jgi:hypothetical protein